MLTISFFLCAEMSDDFDLFGRNVKFATCAILILA